MRRTVYLLIALTLLLPLAAGAQSLEQFKRQLAQPAPAGGARVTVTEHGKAAEAVARASRRNQRKSVHGYRVCIFFDNSPNARAEATRTKTDFEERFPGISVYLTYDNPYWRVTVGDCLSSEEAIILRGRVAGAFPKAFLKNEELALADLLK